MKLVFILGDAAVGKMTVGQELMKITDLRLFHNHMTIEPVIEIFGRYDGKTDLWEYTNIPSRNLAWSVQKKHYHILEPEKIEAILNAECVEDNEYWKMFQARAKELYAAGIINE